MRKRLLCLLLCAGFSGAAEQAMAQNFRSNDPNYGHFYMGRQEWQYVDQSPVVTGTPPGPPGQQQQQGQGAMPAGPPALPKAGWVPYSSTIPSVQQALPKVNNGVPKPMPAANTGPNGMKGKAGSLGARPAAPKAQAGPQTVQTYNSYKGYGGNAPAAAPSAAVGAGTSTSTNVKGNVLKWARPHAKTY